MKALIFGTSGQVATELGLTCPDDAEVIALGRDRADFSDPDACAHAVHDTQPDVVINAVAFTAVDGAETEEELARTVNAKTPGAIARACATLGVPLLHVSTDYVFAGDGTSPWGPDDETAPLNAYGRTKLAGERAVEAAGGAHAIMRTSWVVSAHGSNFIKTMLRLAQTRDRLTIVADQIGGPTPARDIALALWTMARTVLSDPSKSGVYHFSGAPDVSWADFAREIFRQADVTVAVEDISTVDYPTPAARPANSRLDCRSTEQVFSIPRPDWRVGLSDILDTLKEKQT